MIEHQIYIHRNELSGATSRNRGNQKTITVYYRKKHPDVMKKVSGYATIKSEFYAIQTFYPTIELYYSVSPQKAL